MALTLGCACTDRAPANQVGDVLRANQVEEFGTCRYAGACQVEQQATCQTQALVDTEAFIHIGVIDQAFPADGGFKIAIDAVHAASRPHVFMSLTKEGHSAIFSTRGNDDCHIILRGGKKPNYDAASVQHAAEQLEQCGLRSTLMVDCSHANSNKDYSRQIDVCHDIAKQVSGGDKRIMGVMIESHLVEGRQDVVEGKELTYGQSVTDACISWESTEVLLRELSKAVQARRSA